MAVMMPYHSHYNIAFVEFRVKGPHKKWYVKAAGLMDPAGLLDEVSFVGPSKTGKTN